MNKKAFSIARLGIIAVGLISLSGCSMMAYNSKFSDCESEKADPNNCLSATEVYEESERGLPPTRREQLEAERTKKAKSKHTNQHKKEELNAGKHDENDKDVGRVKPTKHHETVMAAKGPRPIRTPAHVMRIYVAPWVGKDGDLTMPTYVFTEIEQRRWSFGTDEKSTSAPAFYPLQVEWLRPIRQGVRPIR